MAFSSPVSAEVWPDLPLKNCSPRRGLWKSRISAGHFGIKKIPPGKLSAGLSKKARSPALEEEGKGGGGWRGWLFSRLHGGEQT